MKSSICPHFPSIKNEKFCNVLKEKKNLLECEGVCSPKIANPDLWLCLDCCFIGCGRYESKCSLEHYVKTSHSIAINFKSLKLWCYDCDAAFEEIINDFEEEAENSKKKQKKNQPNLEKLRNFQEKIQKAVSNVSKTLKNIETKPVIEEKKTAISPSEGLFGLKNIGNTCFFNSVMQCLNATTPLSSIYLTNQNFKDIPSDTSFQENCSQNADNDGWISVSSHNSKKAKNKGYNKEKPKNKSSSTSIESANLNRKFQDFLLEARRNKNKCYDPSALFKSISNLFARFRGYAQQDAQELLRFFLDALSVGEEKLLKSKAHDSEFKGKLKNTNIENIFGAYLCNYLKCLNPECGFESRTFDFCLDLAINIPEPPLARSPVYIAKPSSSRKKNQKKNARRKKQKKIKIVDDVVEEEVKEEQEQENNEEKGEKVNEIVEKNAKESEKCERNTENEEKHKENEEKHEENEEKPKENEENPKENEEKPNENEEEKAEIQEVELPFRPIENSKLDVVPYLDKDIYMLYEPNYKKHEPKYSDISLEDCLEDFFNFEILDIKNNYFSCEKCKKEERLPSILNLLRIFIDSQQKIAKAIKKFFLYDPPPVLTVVLKRFIQRSLGKYEKNHSKIRIPLVLNLDRFTLLKAKKTVEESEIHSNSMHMYELYGIVDHSGSISGGHYIAFAKFDENWYVFNDSDFRVTRVENVLNSDPYILFYRKKP